MKKKTPKRGVKKSLRRKPQAKKQLAKRKKSFAKKRIVKKQIKRKAPRLTKQKSVIPGRYSSTILSYTTKHCPKALDFLLSGQKYDRSVFEPGIAAHALIRNVGERKLSGMEQIIEMARNLTLVLTREGYSFYGEQQPPLNAERVTEGMRIATNWLMDNQVPFPARYETSLSMNRDGEACTFERARYSAKIDCIYFSTEESEDYEREIVTIDDYKSSWQADESFLDHFQQRGQAVLGWLHHGAGRAGVKVRVINLRTGVPYSRVIWFNDEGLQLLNQWRREILDLCDTADKNRKAIPGTGCVGCPFVSVCKDSMMAAKNKPRNDAVAFAVLTAQLKEVKDRLRKSLEHGESIKTQGGKIGWDVVQRNEVTTQAPRLIIERWYGKTPDKAETENGKELGLVHAFSLGVKSVTNVAKTLFSDKQSRQEFLEKCLQKKNVAQFDVWPDEKLKHGEFMQIIENGANNV